MIFSDITYLSMRYIHLIISLLFFLFGVLQYNDRDFYIWIPIYLFVAFISFASFKGISFINIVLGGLLVLSVWTISYIPSFLTWINDGMPSVTGTMKAETLYVEHVREFGGLAISLLVTSIYYFIHKKTNNDLSV